MDPTAEDGPVAGMFTRLYYRELSDGERYKLRAMKVRGQGLWDAIDLLGEGPGIEAAKREVESAVMRAVCFMTRRDT